MIWCMLAALAGAAPFARVREEGDAIRLELATRRYAHEDGTRVALVGVSHIARGEFFDAVQAQLATCEVVLFEGVSGGPTGGGWAEGGLNGAYGAMAEGLGLVFQYDGLDYDQENWKNSDLTLEELVAQASGDGADLAGLLSGGREVQKMEKLAKKAGKSDLVRTMARVMLVESLPWAESAMSVALGPDLYASLVVARNAKVERDLQAERGKSVAILYGAGHLGELEGRLLADGFRAGEETWTVAIDADPASAGMSPAVVAMIRKKVTRKLDKMEAKGRL